VGSRPQSVETKENEPQRILDRGDLLRGKNIRRRKLRKRVTKDKNHDWEMARQDAWLREMLTDSSGSESEEDYVRFAEAGRWIAEMTGTQNGFNDDPKRGVFPTEEAGFLKSS
jgi:Fe-S-cluster formation regulator IscX/YfhJ